MASREATVTKIEEVALRDPFDFPANTSAITYEGISYKFRELTVAETDAAREGSEINGSWDGRLMTRLMICMASVEPTIDMEQLNKVPQRLYAAFVEVVNDLNDPDALLKKDEDQGNS